jgi:SAM-dependent methyltransferase
MIFSIGSGRCVNEAFLVSKGYDILCSDLEWPCKEQTLLLFPELKFMVFDVMSDTMEYRFDCVISLSMCYLFDKNDLQKAFKKIYDIIKPGGRFILDPGGAEDSAMTYFIDEIVCRFEAQIGRLKNFRESQVVEKKWHGYRSKNYEIVSVSESVGFKPHSFKVANYTTEIERSRLLTGLPAVLRKVIGRHMPYVRLFTFIK